MPAPDYTDDFNTDYDMRGAWKAGLLKSEYGGHLPDTFKKPNHPTFSSESIYSSDATPGGDWVQSEGGKWSFRPSETNLQNLGVGGLQDYFKRVEPDAELILPQMVN